VTCVYREVELSGLEPLTPCLQSNYEPTRAVRTCLLACGLAPYVSA
jgi:hypothetical protein